MHPAAPSPGLVVLHGNRLEDLAAAVFHWLQRHPLAPLQPEYLLVASNGMAEWLKMSLATAHGVCAATRVELPARFLWQACRAVLGPAAVPRPSPTDEGVLTWRLMGLMAQRAPMPPLPPMPSMPPMPQPAGASSASLLQRLRAARRVADTFDAYQVYRPDWLDDWARGHDVLRRHPDAADGEPLPDAQRWQAALWRAVLQSLDERQRQAIRPVVLQRFIDTLQRSAPGDPALVSLPPRVVLFGTTHVPPVLMQALHALSRHVQVIVAVPNPCRFHWADTVDGREWWAGLERRRQPWRAGRDLSAIPPAEWHLHGHPLLAAWGRQARDFVRQLDVHDTQLARLGEDEWPRIDLFEPGDGHTLLQRVQARIRDGLPLAEHAEAALADDDRSIVFHVAHGAQREVEILHDQLLDRFQNPPAGTRLQPRNVVVMVPDIHAFEAPIQAIFGQYPRGHPRHIPWAMADLRDRGRHPLLIAVEWLLAAADKRFAASELRALLELPAAARRLGMDDDDVATALAWIEAAQIRWGLDGAHRTRLGLGSCGEANTWRFGLRRMLLGFAAGEGGDGFDGIEPLAEVTGLQAGIAGELAQWLDRLQAWVDETGQTQSAAAWAQRLRTLLADSFEATDDDERAVLQALDQALTRWLEAVEAAGFDETLDLPTVAEAWLHELDLGTASTRFRAGGVTFCTLLPLRAIPFDAVCLLGMNEADFPRRMPRDDIDLLAWPGQRRPGDRARRDDDRQLMLDALLSARQLLYISWTGRSQRDNQAQPPSVLVSQLRDYLDAAWGDSTCARRTTVHPLQPFSERYVAAAGSCAPRDADLFTYAAEWWPPGADPSAALGTVACASSSTDSASVAPGQRAALDPVMLDLASVVRCVARPVRSFMHERLRLRFDDAAPPADDDEPLNAGDALQRWAGLREIVLGAARHLVDGDGPAAAPDDGRVAEAVAREVARRRRSGLLPLGGPGDAAEAQWQADAQAMLRAWLTVLAAYPQPVAALGLRAESASGRGPARMAPAWRFEDRLADARRARAGAGTGTAEAADALPVWVHLYPGELQRAGRGKPHPPALIEGWVRLLAAQAAGQPLRLVVVARDAVATAEAPPAEEAHAAWPALLQRCASLLRGNRAPATALRTALAWLDDPGKAAAVYDGDGDHSAGERRDPHLARLYPDFDALAADPAFEADTRAWYGAYARWLAQSVSVKAHAAAGGANGDDDA